MSEAPTDSPRPELKLPRTVEVGLFVVGCLWAVAAELAARVSSQRLSIRLHLVATEKLMHAVVLVTLLVFGFSALQWIAVRRGGLREVNALPKRSTATREWATGAAFGWALLLLAVLPMMLSRSLLPNFSFEKHLWLSVPTALLTLAVLTLAQELVFRGFLYERLRRGIGTSAATVGMALLYALVSVVHPYATPLSLVVTFVFGILLCVAYLRTHALWLPWGIHFGWAVATSIFFGLPLGGSISYAGIVFTNPSPARPVWLTGGFYGPEGALFTAILSLLLLPVLYSLTRDYAWTYTHEPIVAAGYEVLVQPPAAHTAMETAAAAAPAPLVQIQATTSASVSTMPAVEEHLRQQERGDEGSGS